jgi:hypothetical protein
MFAPSLPPDVVSTDRPLPSRGSAGVRSPRSAVLSADSDCSAAITPHFVAFAWRYLASSPVRSRRPDQRRQAGAASYAVPAPRPRQGTTEPSQVPGRPVRTCPALRPRRSRAIRPLQWRDCCLPVFRIRRLRWYQFRGSITQPARPLCMLRRRDRSRATPHSVPVDGQSLPARDFHPVGRNKEFPIRLSLRSLPLLPGFAWRNELMIEARRFRWRFAFLVSRPIRLRGVLVLRCRGRHIANPCTGRYAGLTA